MMDPHQDTVHLLPYLTLQRANYCPLVVPFLRRRRRSVLDFGSMWHKSTPFDSNSSFNHSLRISNSRVSQPRRSPSHVMEYQLRSSLLSNIIRALLCWSFIRSKMYHRQPQHPRLAAISLHKGMWCFGRQDCKFRKWEVVG